ncbi:serine carboxypeptidase-like 2 isoform X2 [Miscanthus floridulus]|uniref:serine carboxypeptidase-like 2 isoform X2 n=1 Tax=Miscanthus floridulus TaxID=154761 RepID=UPI00345B438B
MAFKPTLPMHAGGGRRHLSLLLRLAAACYLLLLPLSRASSSSSSVVTHLPGFHGPLPFYLETGYVGVDDDTRTELFYYFVESERSPRTDPVLLWLTGGPRCTVFSGLAFEVGPIKFVLAPYTPHQSNLPQLVYNPYSWTQMASILFVDSPVGSGFSYARDPKGYDVGDYSSSLQIVTFLKQWFIDHPQYLSNTFYIGGDSYAGKVVPLIAQYISEGIEERQQPRINLKGYLVGNPVTDSRFDENFVIPASHGFGIISDQLYEAAVEHCKGDYVNPANKLCAEVLLTINNLLSEIPKAHILYDVCPVAAPKPKYNGDSRRVLSEESIQLNEPPDRPKLHCFTYGYYLAYYWMNNDTTRDALGIKEGTVGEWIRCIKGLPYANDLPSSIKYHLNLTTRGYRALVYSGDHDLMVPFLSTQAWIRSLNFSIVDDWRAWHLKGQAAGFTITYANNLTFATVKGGGHTTPEYQPEESFAMAQRWLDGEPL